MLIYIYIYVPVATGPPHPPAQTLYPSPPHCGLGGGVGQPCLVANIHPGPAAEYCIWQHLAAPRSADMQQTGTWKPPLLFFLQFPLISLRKLRNLHVRPCFPIGGVYHTSGGRDRRYWRLGHIYIYKSIK